MTPKQEKETIKHTVRFAIQLLGLLIIGLGLSVILEDNDQTKEGSVKEVRLLAEEQDLSMCADTINIEGASKRTPKR